MIGLNLLSITAKKYKLFDEVSISGISRVNVIIGKNNSGKSSLLDIIGVSYDVNDYVKLKSEIADIVVSTSITENIVRDLFRGYNSIGRWNPKNFYQEYGGKAIEGKISAKGSPITSDKWKSQIEIVSDDKGIQELKQYWRNGVDSIQTFIDGNIFRRIAAERNIVPESESNMDVSPSGEGATNMIRKIINDSTFEESLIEGALLDALNEIMYPEAEYESIRIQQIKKNEETLWEVFLQEKGSSRIPLSKTGSGIKTIILMLLNLIVIPKLAKNSSKRYVYGFEELENNLHPAMQRKVFEYLYDFATKNDVTIFLTTHSHVAINCFYDKPEASMFHIIKSQGKAEVKRIESYLDKAEILADLDVKASDILQANGIIWVEGPSDRVYIKRWLEVFTDNQFKEGQHYQFLYYGGRLLSQYALQEQTELISILTTNRNAAIIIDSDKRNQQASINSTKKRIVEEFDVLHMFSWVTKGKEIENYITAASLVEKFGKNVKQCGKYALFPDYIKRHYNGFTGKKVQFASEVAPFITAENSRGHLDLEEKIKKLYSQIARWNGIE